MASIRRLIVDDLPRLRQFWVEHWGGQEVVSRGNVYPPEQVEGFVIGDGAEWIGLLTFFIKDGECEITSLDSLRKREGIGSMLIDKAIEAAREGKCKRLFLITTNDNLNALGFYQRRRFEIVTIHRGAVNESRRIKPGIPLIGMNNIPLRDEIELEIIL